MSCPLGVTVGETDVSIGDDETPPGDFAMICFVGVVNGFYPLGGNDVSMGDDDKHPGDFTAMPLFNFKLAPTVHQALAPKTYRLLHAEKKTCGMFNAAYHMHQLQSLNCECETNLQFAFKSEKHQGVCWNETLK